jgi:hypothetical protein
MKNILYLITTVIAVLAVGCSRQSNPVAYQAPVSNTSVVTIDIAFPNPPILKKELAQPTYAATYIKVRNVGAAVDSFTDSIRLTSGQTSVTKSYSVVRNTAYNFMVSVYSDGSGLNLNYGETGGIVPDSATFSVAITCEAQAEKLDLQIPFPSTVKAVACSAQVMWAQLYPSQAEPVNGSSKSSFTPGSVDTAFVTGLIQLINAPAITSFTIYTTIWCSDGSYYTGQGNIDLSPSTNSSLSITLTKYGGTGSGSLAKLVITVSSTGVLTATVVFP